MSISLLYSIKIAVEHQLKHLGLFTGLFFVLVIFPVLTALDWFIGYGFPVFFSASSLFAVNGTLASFLIGILATTFSVVFVVMQLASSQFSPRILRYFMYSDVHVQQFIGLYLGAIALAFLPQFFFIFFPALNLQSTVLFSILLNFYCLIVAFPRMITHLSDNMNVATITHQIKLAVHREIDAFYPMSWSVGMPLLNKRKRTTPGKWHLNIIWQGPSGYLSEVNYKVLNTRHIAISRQFPLLDNALLFQIPIVGEFIMTKTTVVMTIELDESPGTQNEELIRQAFLDLAAETFQVNKYRSYTQDINFGVRKLVDISIKAISPAVNDPTTCLNCIDHIGDIVRQLAIRRFPSGPSSALKPGRIFINEFNFDELVDFCFDQIVQWGKGDPVVIKRIISVINQILPHVQNPFHVMVLIKQVEDMEIEKLQGAGEMGARCSAEQTQSIFKEWHRFRQNSANHISRILADGQLDPYLHAELPDSACGPIDRAERECIQWLMAFNPEADRNQS